MSQYFFKTPFADSGTVATIPRPTQVSGTVSFEQGFPIAYQQDPATVPGAQDVPRDQFNELMNLITGAMQILQVHGFPDFITTADNDGVAYSYDLGSTVRFTGGWASTGAANYYSLVDANTSTPSDNTKWGLVTYQSFETAGVVKMYDGSTLPNGYVWSNGNSIGNAASNATGRANADTSQLFTVLWSSFPQSTLPMLNSSGAVTSRGVSAAADFAANCQMPTIDRRGIVTAGADNMGGAAAAGRITISGSGVDGSTLGASGGAQAVSLTSAQNGPHVHSASSDQQGVHFHTGTTDSGGSHNHTVTGSNSTGSPITQLTAISSAVGNLTSENTNTAGVHTHTFTTGNAGLHSHNIGVASSGSGSTHENLQPTAISNFIIALGTA